MRSTPMHLACLPSASASASARFSNNLLLISTKLGRREGYKPLSRPPTHSLPMHYCLRMQTKSTLHVLWIGICQLD
jgi:hypothetical protein